MVSMEMQVNKELRQMRRKLNKYIEWAKQVQASNEAFLNTLNNNLNMVIKLFTFENNLTENLDPKPHLGSQHEAEDKQQKAGPTIFQTLDEGITKLSYIMEKYNGNTRTADIYRDLKSQRNSKTDKKNNKSTLFKSTQSTYPVADEEKPQEPILNNSSEENLNKGCEKQKSVDSESSKITNKCKLIASNCLIVLRRHEINDLKPKKVASAKKGSSVSDGENKSLANPNSSGSAVIDKESTIKCLKKSSNEKTKSPIKRKSSRLKLTREEFERRVKALRTEDEELCNKCPMAVPLSESYLEFAAARGRTMEQIRKIWDEKHRTSRHRKMTMQSLLSKRVKKKRKSNNTARKTLFTGKQFYRRLKVLRGADERICKKDKGIEPLPDSYLAFAAARGHTIEQIRKKFENDQKLHKIKISQNVEIKSETKLDGVMQSNSMTTNPNATPSNINREQFEGNLKKLRKEHDEIRIKYPKTIYLPESYLEFGAARGWTLKQISQKHLSEIDSITNDDEKPALH